MAFDAPPPTPPAYIAAQAMVVDDTPALLGVILPPILRRDDAPSAPRIALSDELIAEGPDTPMMPQVRPLRFAVRPAPAEYAAIVAAAARRTGLPVATLTAILSAETGGAGGAWKADATNPRSSAAGLGQFLESTWIAEAQRADTFLNKAARTAGWAGIDGAIVPMARQPLLALRYDPRHAIEATADLARSNLDRLARRGFTAQAVPEKTRLAYIAHHLGVGDAIAFLGQGLDEARARLLLAAQVGRGAALDRIAVADGSAASAYRAWLDTYLTLRLTARR